MKIRLAATITALCLFSATTQAVSLRTVIRDCGDDGKKLCPKAGYGQPMQDCLSANFKNLSPACKVVIKKIEGGERVTFF